MLKNVVEKLSKSKAVIGLSRGLWDSDLIATRISLSIAEFLWGVMLLWPGDTFYRPTYEVMSRLMSEEAWGILLIVSSATQLTIVMEENFHSQFARIFSAWNACLWLVMVASMLLSVYPPPAAIGGEIALALAACWVWLRPYILQGMYDKVCEKCEYE